MTFVTKLTFESGDRTVLDDVVSELKRMLERKGAECKGPHSSQPERLSVPQYRNLHERSGGEFAPWSYTVYTRRLEIHGADQVARSVAGRSFPDSVHVEIEIEQKKPLGHRQR